MTELSCERWQTKAVDFECVSPPWRSNISSSACVPDLDLQRVLFTPNFAPRADYEQAREDGRSNYARQSLSTAGLARSYLKVKRSSRPHRSGYRSRASRLTSSRQGQRVEVRRTPMSEIDELAILAVAKAGADHRWRVHAHSGSGIPDPERTWGEVAERARWRC